MRRTVAVVLFLVVLLIAVPVSAHAVNYQLLKAGGTECGATEDVHTRIQAQAHHKHKKGGSEVIIHLPADGVTYTTDYDWEVFTMSWSLHNQSGFPWSGAGTFAYCGG